MVYSACFILTCHHSNTSTKLINQYQAYKLLNHVGRLDEFYFVVLKCINNLVISLSVNSVLMVLFKNTN